MWNSYFTYLDYLEIRRRIERRLSHSMGLFLHIAVFVITPLVGYFTSIPAAPSYYPPWWRAYYSPFLVHPWIGAVMFGWALVLLLHGLLTYFSSGAWGSTLSYTVESEMRQRLVNSNGYLVQDARDLFRLHRLLENDVRRRASATITPLAIFTVLNGGLWMVARGGTYSSFAWGITPFIALALLPILTFNLWRVGRHERKLRDLLATAKPSSMKPKRDVLHLADDGEVLDIIEGDVYGKRKRS